MAQFRQIILDYLENVEPEKYEALRARRELFSTVMVLSTSMAEEAAEVAKRLKNIHPSMSAIEADIQAQAIVISECLPTVGADAEDIVNLRDAG